MIGASALPLILSTLFLGILSILPRLLFNFKAINRTNRLFTSVVNEKQPILVVGGGGYIGSHVVEKLLNQGQKVRVFDKFIYGKEVLFDLAKNPNLEIIEGDISDLYSLTLALTDVKAVVHLAGIVGDPACALDDSLTRHINIAATRMLKETVKAFKVPKFIFASSCSVYGANDKKVNEKSKLNPVSLYARSKIDAEEELLKDPYDDFHPTILRFATVFGHSRKPRFDLVANLFTAQAHNEGLVTVVGSNQWRPFIHVADVAEAVVMVVNAPQETVSRQIFNVGDDRGNITIGNLAKTVKKAVKTDKKGNKIKITVSDNVADHRNYNVSFAKIHTLLGFEAKHDIREGVAEMNDHFAKKTYKKHYKDPYYSNLEMTKELQREFETAEYKSTHMSVLGERITYATD